MLAGQPSMQLDVTDDTQKIYDSVPTTEASFNLPLSALELKDKLGAGCFGSVLKGIYRHGGQAIPVAVKTLKLDDEAGKVMIVVACAQNSSLVVVVSTIIIDFDGWPR